MLLADYDIGAAFEAIEDELIASMIRNMDRHRAWEDDEGIQWSMWQAEQLKTLEKYKKANQKRYGKQFKDINGQIGEILYKARQTGNMQQEIQILNAIKNGFTGANKVSQGTAAEFFRLNNRKLEALIEATTNDMERAETAILRKANDEYRKVIYNAQVYANTGAGTYEKAVDMATKDMLSRGLTCVEYANGARHTLADYADMAIRTASKRAYLQGEGEKRQEWGITTVIMVKRGNPCPKCLPFVGKVLIDDVWSGGKKSDGSYPLMSKAIAAGLYHPRCKDSHTTYFPGISTADDSWTEKELEDIGQANTQETKQQYAKRQTEKVDRLSDNSLDDENRKQYQQKAEAWKKQCPISIGGIDCAVTKEDYGLPDGCGGVKRTAKATIYETPDGTKFVFPEKMNSAKQMMTPEKAIELWQNVPETIRQQGPKTIEFVDYYNPQDSYWKKKYKNFTHSYATGGDKITFYRHDYPHNDDYVVRTYCHESGHYIDRQIASTEKHFSSEVLWTESMKKDIIESGKKSPTPYGENAPAEDFAESIAEYVADTEAFKKSFPNRASLLNLILGI